MCLQRVRIGPKPVDYGQLAGADGGCVWSSRGRGPSNHRSGSEGGTLAPNVADCAGPQRVAWGFAAAPRQSAFYEYDEDEDGYLDQEANRF